MRILPEKERSLPMRLHQSLLRAARLNRTILATVLAIAALVLFANQACAQQEDLATLFEEAREEFRPITEDELWDARGEVLDSMDALERFVRPGTRNGDRWLRYLRWEALDEAMGPDGPPPIQPLATTYRRLNRDERGLELPQFRRLAGALRRYMQFLQLTQQEDQEQYFRRQIDRLEQQLEQYRNAPDSTAEMEIGSRLGFLADIGEAPELVGSVRREFSRPNAYINVATSLLAATAEPIFRREIIHDNILGTNITGDAQTTGTVNVASIPSNDKAVLELVSSGRTCSENVGYNGPVVIRSTSFTDFTATKRVELTDEFFAARPASASARTNSRIQSVSSRRRGLFSRMISNIGRRRAEQSRPQADAIASGRATGRVARNFNQEVSRDLRDARRRYDEEFRRPLARRGELPAYTHFSSDHRSVRVELAQATPSQLGAAGRPPWDTDGDDLTARLHQSAVNNYTASLVGGATASETSADEDVQFDVKLPDWIQRAWQRRRTEPTDGPEAEGPFRDWALTFRDNRPVSVEFGDGEIGITLHIVRLKSGDRTFTNWDVTGRYIPELAGGQIVLHRDGELEMLPTGFTGTLSSRQVAERRNLEEELNARSAEGRGFPQSIELDPLQPEGMLAEAGPLDVTSVVTGDGWLLVAWNRRR
jgi:hypothetical protein